MNKLMRVLSVVSMSVVFCIIVPMYDGELDKQDSKPDLWEFIKNDYSSDQLADALTYDDETVLSPQGSCLLHGLVWQTCYQTIYNMDDFLKKGEILAHALPDKINALNNRELTPVDAAYIGYNTARCEAVGGTPGAFQKLITLYKSHGGKTAQELLKENMILLLHNDSNVGDLAILPYDVRKYVVGFMACYFKQEPEGYVGVRHDCSICRNTQEKQKS